MAGIVADGRAKSVGKNGHRGDLHSGPVRRDGSGAKTGRGRGGQAPGPQ
jgi:hypothetical protein